jgi:hypothetical protein
VKVLEVRGFFRLPDDFVGGYNEALIEWAKYLGCSGENTITLGDLSSDDRKSLWNDFLYLPDNERFIAAFGISEIDWRNNEQSARLDAEQFNERINHAMR